MSRRRRALGGAGYAHTPARKPSMASPGGLWVIGLGLGDERDVTLKGADAIRGADVVFLEAYTSILGVPAAALEAAFGVRIHLAHRETVELEAELILGPAREGMKVAFLVVGDPVWCARARAGGRVAGPRPCLAGGEAGRAQSRGGGCRARSHNMRGWARPPRAG